MSYGDTPHFSKNLCQSCRFAHWFKNHDGDNVICNMMTHDVKISSPVYECNKYEDKSKPSIYDMERIAWTFETDKQKTFTGFAPPKHDEDRPIRWGR